MFFTNIIQGRAQNNSSLLIEGNSTKTNATHFNSAPEKQITHHPRENIPIDSTVESPSSTPNSIIEIGTNNTHYVLPKKNDGTSSVAKKGVNLPTTVTNISTIITTPSSQDINSSVSSVDNSTKQNNESMISTVPINPKIINGYGERSRKYIVPVVAIVFSLPIVSLIFWGTYKLGSEWWQHRHYRRMDFLIEGMYNN